MQRTTLIVERRRAERAGVIGCERELSSSDADTGADAIAIAPIPNGPRPRELSIDELSLLAVNIARRLMANGAGA